MMKILSKVMVFILVVLIAVVGLAVDFSKGDVVLLVTDFAVGGFGKQPTGIEKVISEAIQAKLSAKPNMAVVEREKLDKLLEEMKLTTTGLMASESAAKVGGLLGADYMVTGSLMRIGESVVFNVRVVEIETAEIFAKSVDRKERGQLLEVLDSLVDLVVQAIKEKAEKKPTGMASETRLPKFMPNLPSVAVYIPETQLGRPTADRTVEVEMIKELLLRGFKVFDFEELKEVESEDAIKLLTKADPETTNKIGQRYGFDLLVTGHALCTPGGWIGDWVVCQARAEIKVIETGIAKVLLAEQKEAKSTGLTLMSAAGRSFEKVGALIAKGVADQILRKWCVETVETPAPGTEKGMRIAVFNFRNASENTEIDWLCKGLADMLITDLSSSKDLRVVERERLVKLLKELKLEHLGFVEEEKVKEIGKLLGVDVMLFGSFVKGGEKIRIDVHLVDAKSWHHILDIKQEGAFLQVADLEHNLAVRVLEALRVEGPLRKEELKSEASKIPEALLHFYRGLDYYDQCMYDYAVVEFEEALGVDPNYAEALLWLIKSYMAQEEYEHALIECKKFLKDYPNSRWAHQVQYFIGRCYEEIGE